VQLGEKAEKIHDDMVAAMKAKDRGRVSVLRMLIASIKDASIESKRDLEDDEVIRLLSSYARKREETLVEVRKA